MGKNGLVVNEIKLRLVQFHCIFSFERRAAKMKAHSLTKFSLDRGLGAMFGWANLMTLIVSHTLWSFMNIGFTPKKELYP